MAGRRDASLILGLLELKAVVDQLRNVLKDDPARSAYGARIPSYALLHILSD